MKKKKEILSKCCHGNVKSSMSPDFIGDDVKTMRIGTCNYYCLNCGQPCEIIYEQKLKDIIFTHCIITIKKLQHRYKEDLGIRNENECFLVTMREPSSGRRIMFRADSVEQLFDLIKQEGRFYL